MNKFINLFTKRYRMFKLLNKLNNCFNSNIDPLSVVNPDEDKPLLIALKQLDCIDLFYADNQIYSISRGPRSEMYPLERFELNLYRIIGFILGFFTVIVFYVAIK